ncbi:MAG: hypothetical protein IJR13_07780 [Bacteroidales bacterium]|nr:hypothetical protein [Bacteroidales bacterium]
MALTTQNTDSQMRKSKRDALKERMATKYPDKQFEDDEALFGQIDDDYDQYDQDIARYKEHDDKLADMFTSDPRSAAFLINWRDGGDPAVELVRLFGDEIRDALDDPERQEAIAEANKEFVQKVAKEKELEEQYQSNLQESLRLIDEYESKNGLTDEQVDQAMSWLMRIVSDGVMGKFSPETIDMAMKAINHDGDVAIADREGEVRGRNAKIDERLRQRESSDGMPQLDGSNGAAGGSGRARSIFDLAEEAR